MINHLSAVIVAGGMGTRLGKPIPKAFVPLAGKPLFIHSLEVLAAHPSVQEAVVVVPGDMVVKTQRLVKKHAPGLAARVVVGGRERWESVRNGVIAVADETDWVIVHDAARPFVSASVVDAVIDKAQRFRAVITATRVDDTIRMYEGDVAAGTVDRTKLVRVGTPQLFHRETLLRALGAAAGMDPAPTDEAMLMERLGEDVGIAWGDPMNFKITTPGDLKIAEAIVRAGGGS